MTSVPNEPASLGLAIPPLDLCLAAPSCSLDVKINSVMSATESETQVVTAPKKAKKLKPARKQVKPGEVEKKEAPQTGKEYSASSYPPTSSIDAYTTAQTYGTTNGPAVTARTAIPSKYVHPPTHPPYPS